MNMRRIDYVLNAKDPIKVFIKEFDLKLDCRRCTYKDVCHHDYHYDCGSAFIKYLKEDIEVNESDLKTVEIEEKINTKETLQKTLDEVKEILQKTLDEVKEPVENEFMEEYKKIVTETMELCVKKNKDYGSSVQDTFEKFGDISYLVRITDKYNRICSLLQNGKAEVEDESCSDTIRDMGNYLFLWLASRNLKEKK